MPKSLESQIASIVSHMRARTFRLRCYANRITSLKMKNLKNPGMPIMVTNVRIIDDLHMVTVRNLCDDCRKKRARICINGTWLCPWCVTGRAFPKTPVIGELEARLNEVIDVFEKFLWGKR